MNGSPWQGGVAVVTGAASGFGLEACRIAAARGMKIVMADVQADALATAAREIEGLGAPVLAQRVDVAKSAEVQALAAATAQRFGAPKFVFNNAGVGSGGLAWEQSANDWDWVVGVNLLGVANGVRAFTPSMLAAAKADPAYQGHIVNTASMAGLLNPPNTAVYSATKAAVVSLSETLHHDLALVTDQVHAHLLCPFYVATGIHESGRNRPGELADQTAPSKAQLLARAMTTKAVTSGRVSAAQVAQFVFDAMDAGRFYVYSHPHALSGVKTVMEDRLQLRNPTDPYAGMPQISEQMRAALRES